MNNDYEDKVKKYNELNEELEKIRKEVGEEEYQKILKEINEEEGAQNQQDEVKNANYQEHPTNDAKKKNGRGKLILLVAIAIVICFGGYTCINTRSSKQVVTKQAQPSKPKQQKQEPQTQQSEPQQQQETAPAQTDPTSQYSIIGYWRADMSDVGQYEYFYFDANGHFTSFMAPIKTIAKQYSNSTKVSSWYTLKDNMLTIDRHIMGNETPYNYTFVWIDANHFKTIYVTQQVNVERVTEAEFNSKL